MIIFHLCIPDELANGRIFLTYGILVGMDSLFKQFIIPEYIHQGMATSREIEISRMNVEEAIRMGWLLIENIEEVPDLSQSDKAR